jgi:hypothetical protein
VTNGFDALAVGDATDGEQDERRQDGPDGVRVKAQCGVLVAGVTRADKRKVKILMDSENRPSAEILDAEVDEPFLGYVEMASVDLQDSERRRWFTDLRLKQSLVKARNGVIWPIDRELDARALKVSKFVGPAHGCMLELIRNDLDGAQEIVNFVARVRADLLRHESLYSTVDSLGRSVSISVPAFTRVKNGAIKCPGIEDIEDWCINVPATLAPNNVKGHRGLDIMDL